MRVCCGSRWGCYVLFINSLTVIHNNTFANSAVICINSQWFKSYVDLCLIVLLWWRLCVQLYSWAQRGMESRAVVKSVCCSSSDCRHWRWRWTWCCRHVVHRRHPCSTWIWQSTRRRLILASETDGRLNSLVSTPGLHNSTDQCGRKTVNFFVALIATIFIRPFGSMGGI